MRVPGTRRARSDTGRDRRRSNNTTGPPGRPPAGDAGDCAVGPRDRWTPAWRTPMPPAGLQGRGELRGRP
ncbi:hypothetical protein, partial [Streptomyces albogriseolus]